MRLRLRRAGIALALLALACGGDAGAGDGAGEGAAAPDSAAGRFALLTAGPVSDAGWYAGAYEGLMLLRDSLGAQVSHQQTATPAEFDEAFRAYGGAGYDVVFAHGFEYQDAALRAGAAFPDMKIVVSGGGKLSPNVAALLFTLEEAAYLAGVAAGGMTKTGVVGMVGGVATPPLVATFDAFEAGVKSAKLDARLLRSYIGNWDDVSAAKEAAVAQLRQNADVIIHNTDAASFGVFQAVREATAAGDSAWAIGMNNDQNSIAPEVTLGSAVIRIPKAFAEVARVWRAGELGGEAIYTGMAQGVVDYVPNPAVLQRYPPALLQSIDDARRGILAGTVEVPRLPLIEGESGGA
jgi:basic membrane lipoprotein Med (substrate-binding protein (PBP1-ABC) superfamily)